MFSSQSVNLEIDHFSIDRFTFSEMILNFSLKLAGVFALLVAVTCYLDETEFDKDIGDTPTGNSAISNEATVTIL